MTTEKPNMVRPWNELRDSYQERVNSGMPVQSMLQLVDQILASRYLGGLHAWTSMHSLCIVQVPHVVYPYDGPLLVIEPLFNGTTDFRYVDTRDKEKQWHRVVKEGEEFQRLEKFLDQLCWFPRREPMV